MNTPLLIEPPKDSKSSIVENHQLPDGQPFRLVDAYVIGKQWGVDGDEYFYHQLQEVHGMVIGVVSIQVKKFSLLRMRCAKDYCILLYVLEGFSFAHLAGYGMLTLFSKTYSLQYLPAANHDLFLAPGMYHYLYIIPGPLLSFLAQGHTTATQMIAHMSELYDRSYVSAQLPLLSQVHNGLLKLSCIESDGHKMAHRIRATISDLILCFQQAQNKAIYRTVMDQQAEMALFTATHLQWSVPSIITALCDNFFMQPPTLRQHWLRCFGDTPKKSLKQLRLYLALYLLVVEKRSVAATADYLGFPHATHFSAQFLAQYKIAPSKAAGIVSI